jgi:large subunit ribosomal protein L9
MQLILREDVENLGRKGDVVEVARGYARNYLLPRRLALPVNDNNMRHVQKQARLATVRAANEKAEAETLGARLASVRLEFKRKVHQGTELYGSVSATDIAEGLAALGYEVEKRRIQLDEPIKTLGEYPVAIRLHAEVTASILVAVEKEEED